MKKSLQSRFCALILTVALIVSVCTAIPVSAADTNLPAAQLLLSEKDGILTLSVQLKGTKLARTQCIALSYDAAALSLLRSDGTAAIPTIDVTAYDAQQYVTAADGWTSGVANTVSGKNIPMLEHGTAGTDRGLLLLYPTAATPQTYTAFQTVLTLRFSRIGTAALNAASIRLFSSEEQTAAAQSVRLMLCTETAYYTYGSQNGGDLLTAPAFVGHPIISGAAEADPADPNTSWSNPFVDITDDLLYYEAIAYVAQNGLFVGNDKNQFMPDDPMNRATFSTVLCRLAGAEESVKAAPPTESAFTDVPVKEWYAPYVTWASDQKLLLGYGNGSYGPNDPITHEQMYLIVQRFLESRGYQTKNGADVSLSFLSDADKISPWAVDAVKFAHANGLLIVDANRTVRPTEQAARWELAVLLQSLSEIPQQIGESTAVLSNSLGYADIPLAPPAADSLVRGAIETVYNGLLAASDEINLASFRLNKEQLSTVYYEAAKHSELFYVGNLYHFTYNSENGVVLSVQPTYTMEGTELHNALKQYNAGLNELLSGVDSTWSDLEKILYLHDLLAARYVYDDSLAIFDTLSLMQTGRGVCQAYTLLLGALLDAVGIENALVTSEVMNHTWNLVRLNGKWYHIDATWDDPRPDQLGQVRHDYLLKSDAYMRANKHEGWYGYDNILCTDTTYDNAFFNLAHTPFVTGDDGLWYYINNNSGDIFSWDPKSNATTRIFSTGIRWTTANSIYRDKFTGLVRIGRQLIYNSADSILSYNLDTKAVETVHKTTATGYICGLTLKWMTNTSGVSVPYLVYQIRTTPVAAESRQYNVSAVNLFTYSLTGTVRGFFADAVTKITLTCNGTSYKTLTLPRTNVFLETDQTFTFDGIKPGRYDLTVEKKGCFTYTVKNIDISANTDLENTHGAITLLCGDISGDGKIDAADCALLLRIGTFRHTKEQAQHASADLSGDGIIDIVDYAILTDSDRFGKDKSMCIVSHAA